MSRRDRSSRGELGGDQIEGRQAVRELLLAGNRRVREVLVSADGGSAIDDLSELARQLGVSVQEVGAAKLRSLARTEVPQGIVARAEPLAPVDIDDLTVESSARPGRPFVVVLDGVTDPGNVGAILRSAECAGATGAVLARHRAAHITPAAAKAAAGAVEYLPMALVGGIPSVVADLSAKGLWTIGLDAAGERGVSALDLLDEPLALVVGSEGRGLSKLVRQRCDVLASIRLRGRLESLNAGAAAAVACFDVARSRG